MKEKEVRLTLEEIDYLLKGTIHWDEIESRVDVPQRRPIQSTNVQSSLGQSELQLEDPSLEGLGLKSSISHRDQVFYEPFLEGNKVYWVLSGVGILTLGTWVYFVFAR